MSDLVYVLLSIAMVLLVGLPAGLVLRRVLDGPRR